MDSLRDQFIDWFLRKVLRLSYRDIKKNGELYLRRYFLRRKGKLRIFIHYFGHSDDDAALHDHPWGFYSLILLGRYIEETFALFEEYKTEFKSRGWLSFGFRAATHRHRVHLDGGKKVWTMIFAGKAERSWFFWPDYHTKVHWREYLGIPKDAPNEPEDE